VTFRLLHLASENWPTLEGWATSRNTDLIDLPIHRMLNLVYYWATRNAQDEQALAKFDRKLWMPPKGEVPPPESPWSAQNETDAFKAFKQQIQPDGPAAPKAAASTTTAREQPGRRGTLANSNGTPGSRGRPVRGG
jgi:hypothetical protein